ncbi:hypothetical protein ACJOWW_12160 [Acinetobacter baumannii]|uniref:hypothetical protein n=1 Tax=Acinetobacter baumannii TaxID=470 RepID=UPI00044E8D2A|nr:hypothetical protein [Acinetobacter baumannii]EXH88111.1 hypothetical protein J606_3128 [Acinetobacter baumannii 318814]MDC5437817.1 hypothetical protein [Acinetobacter baumannii]MDH2589292.1 hypothetical protein [Acinetobacter baumannii]MDO7463059.1 hypothetical protein [Acinetobacter baumannii]MDV7378313.1 hypothetical protein [Acinetobacter baumannii]
MHINFQNFKELLFKDFAFGDVWEAVLAAIIIAIVFFWVRERVFGIPDLSGQWYLRSKTEATAYKPYEKMELQHNLFLRLEGNNIRGASEKIYEDSSYGKRKTHVRHILEYTGKYRARASIEGSIQKNIFGPDILTLHATEYGEKRQSTIYCRFELKKKYFFLSDRMETSFEGDFYSMVADQRGTVGLSKVPFPKSLPEVREKG